MESILAMALVLLVAAAFVGISYYRKTQMYPLCDRFAAHYCSLADLVLGSVDVDANLAFDALDGGKLRLRPMEEQAESMRAILERAKTPAAVDDMRELFLLRDEIQSRASTGSLSKDKYNAILNQLYNAADAFIAIAARPEASFTKKDYDNMNYFLHQQRLIRNRTLPAIISNACKQQIAVL